MRYHAAQEKQKQKNKQTCTPRKTRKEDVKVPNAPSGS